jgi:hypothetical protein
MAWLNFGLPLEEELEVEKHVRMIRACDDTDRLREIAEQAFRAWVQQADIVSQLIPQLAEAELLLAQAGFAEEPDEQYVQWARELYPETWRSGQS